MAKGSAKKPKPAKSRGSGTPLEGRPWIRIGGSRWLREDAERAGKFIPREYREGYVKPAKAGAVAVAEPEAPAAPESAEEPVEAAEVTVEMEEEEEEE